MLNLYLYVCWDLGVFILVVAACIMWLVLRLLTVLRQPDKCHGSRTKAAFPQCIYKYKHIYIYIYRERDV